MNRDYRDERWNEKRDRYQQDQYSNWQNSSRQLEDNPNRGGYMGSLGSNYAAGTFSGVAYGRGLTEDNYRGHNYSGNPERNFGNKYNEAYGNRRQVNYIPDNDENRRNTSDNRSYEESETAARFGYGGHYGAGGSYGSFGGPASSRFNVPEKRNRDRGGAYSSDFGWQGQGSETDDRGSRMERLTGGHRGKGPRGYHRSDERIWEDVNDRLSDDAYIDASDIDVKIENGTVILSGYVQDRSARRRAEEIAESVRGVANVENRLHIGEGIMENAAHAFTSGIGDVTIGHDRSRR